MKSTDASGGGHEGEAVDASRYEKGDWVCFVGARGPGQGQMHVSNMIRHERRRGLCCLEDDVDMEEDVDETWRRLYVRGIIKALKVESDKALERTPGQARRRTSRTYRAICVCGCMFDLLVIWNACGHCL